MSVALTTTFNPRGEIGRLQRLYDRLREVYSDIIISMPPVATADDVAQVRALPEVRVYVNQEWAHGRHRALREALATEAGHIHYADMDRLLRWVETRESEWREVVAVLPQYDCLVLGRTEAAWDTHPQALRQTEAISNDLFSKLLGKALDLSAGSKAFSQRAVVCLMANTLPERALGADAEWIVILHRAGFEVAVRLVDGLDWETADRFADSAADRHMQRAAAEHYDTDATRWAMRVKVAQEIVAAGLDAWTRPLVQESG